MDSHDVSTVLGKGCLAVNDFDSPVMSLDMFRQMAVNFVEM